MVVDSCPWRHTWVLQNPSFIRGKVSTIKESKAYGEMFFNLLVNFYHLFYSLEDNGVLIPDRDIDIIILFAVHFPFKDKS